jgi:hypothetical protein
MAEESVAPERPLTGDEIISEILRNSAASRFALRRSVLLPSIFYVYLHPADFDYIRPVLKALTAEARVALAEQMTELNRKAKPSGVARMLGLEGKGPVEYKIADSDWTVQFFADAEDRLERGEIEVHSELASTPRPDFDGAMTRHVTRGLGAAVDSGAAPTMPSPAESEFARLRYMEAGAPREFSITRPQTVIGRGGKTHWVDVRLEGAPPDISREHCRIRRDENGRFFVSDVSQFGTSVNGSPAAKGPGETPMPARATLSLAGVFEIEFEISDGKQAG